MLVRSVVPEDRTQWLELWQAWQRHMQGQVPADLTERTWRGFFEADSALSCLVAEHCDRLHAFACMSLTPFAWTGSPVVFLQDFFIDEAARGTGLGSALLHGVYDFADARGASNVFWFVDADDDRLKGFYDRHAVRTPYLRYMRRPWPY